MDQINSNPIQQRLMEFIRKELSPENGSYSVRKLLGDASSRQYYRYVAGSGESYIMAAYPEPFSAEHFSYREIYDLLRLIDVPVPEILKIDGSLGIVFQEDLGDESLQSTLAETPANMKKILLESAMDMIIKIQEKGTNAFKPEYEGHKLAFDHEKLIWEFNFFNKHYLGNYRGVQYTSADRINSEFEVIAEELSSLPRVLCHRDFHVRNIMVKNGIQYLIDFQDARWGPMVYDVASLLKDSLTLNQETINSVLLYYREEISKCELPDQNQEGLEPEAFLRQFHLMSIQRLLKALGTYGYQVIVRDNFIYEQYMKGSLQRVALSLRELAEFPHIEYMIEKELQYKLETK
ncbi:MAG: phosphotransferase [Acidobacteriota bacterium]